jgi:hypothetical protein
MVEQEQLSGILLMVQQLLYIFALWNTAEPNPVQWSPRRLRYITAPGVGITGSWNDLTNTGILPEIINLRVTLLNMAEWWRSYFKIAASTTITIPKVTGTTATSMWIRNCHSGNFFRRAINWYANASGGTSLATTNSLQPNFTNDNFLLC